MTSLSARRTAPPAAVEYFIDCALHAGEMDACTGMTLRLYGDDSVLVPFIGTPVQRRGTWRERAQLNIELGHVADGILERLPPTRRAGLVRLGLVCIADEIVQMAETFSNWAVEDSTEGGCLLPFKRRPRSRAGIPFKRTARRLYSPKFIRRYVKHHAHEAGHLTALSRLCVARAISLPALGKMQPDPTIIADIGAQVGHRQKLDWRRDRHRERVDRKVILRSLKQAQSIVGVETVAAFLRGEEIRLIGGEAILAVRKRAGLAER